MYIQVLNSLCGRINAIYDINLILEMKVCLEW